MYICPVCNNDTFRYRKEYGEIIAVCTVCGEDFLDYDDEEYEDEEDLEECRLRM